jgi:hypothetical protein
LNSLLLRESSGTLGVVLMASPATTPNANEFILFRAKGNCYKFVRVAKEWSKTGEGCAVRHRFLFFLPLSAPTGDAAARPRSQLAPHCGVSVIFATRTRVFSLLRSTKRLADDNSVVLESSLYAGLESELRKTFLQWRDGQRILGVKFTDEAVGARFAQRLASVVSGIGNEDGAAVPAAAVAGNGASPGGKETRRGTLISRRSGVALLTPQVQTSRQLFQRVESLAMPESNFCCVCGTERNDLLLKAVTPELTVEGEPLRLTQTRPDAVPKRLCTACWIKNLLEQQKI